MNGSVSCLSLGDTSWYKTYKPESAAGAEWFSGMCWRYGCGVTEDRNVADDWSARRFALQAGFDDWCAWNGERYRRFAEEQRYQRGLNVDGTRTGCERSGDSLEGEYDR